MARLQRSSASLPRTGFLKGGLIVALGAAAAGLAVVSLVFSGISGSSGKDAGPMMYRVERKEFIHDVTERGNVESASNVEIVSKVRSNNSMGTTILWIIPEGTVIKPEDCLPKDFEITFKDLEKVEELKAKMALSGENGANSLDALLASGAVDCEDPEKLKILMSKLVLVRLDSSALESQQNLQEITCENSKAAVIKATNVLDTARTTKQEYLEGLYHKEWMDLDIQLAEARIALSQAQEYLAHTEKLYRKNYATKLQLQNDTTAVTKAENKVKLLEKQIWVLENLTKEKQVKTLEADIKTAEANLAAEEASHALDVDKLQLIEEQIVNCTIYAREPGQVVYANDEGFRGRGEIVIEEGTLIRERQTIIRLPDPSRMQVKAQVSESRISLIRPGLTASVRLDAFPDEQFSGVVTDVSEYPVGTGWFGSSVKEYETLISIQNQTIDLRPGLTAEVKIRVETLKDRLQVPVQAILEHSNKHYCVLRDGAGFVAHPVTIGSTNDKFVVIKEGLEEGMEVVRNAAAFREKVNLPKLLFEKRDRAEAEPTDAARPPPAGRAAPERPSPAERFKRFDINQDGKLEKSELPGPMQPFFAASDTDQSGAIDLGEWTAAINAIRQRMREQGGGRAPRPGDGGGSRPGGARGRRPAGGGRSRSGGSR